MKQKITKQESGFTQIKNEPIDELGFYELGLYVYIYRQADDYDFSSERISETKNSSRKTCDKYLKKLEKLGYLLREKQLDGRMNYYLNYDKKPMGKIYSEQNLLRVKNTHINNTNIYINKETQKKFIKPTPQEIKEYCELRKNKVDYKQFYNHYESNGWKVGKNPMKDWKASVRTWEGHKFDTKPKRLDPIEIAERKRNVDEDGTRANGISSFADIIKNLTK